MEVVTFSVRGSRPFNKANSQVEHDTFVQSKRLPRSTLKEKRTQF